MSDDIVERLRNNMADCGCSPTDEAADEIERLRRQMSEAKLAIRFAAEALHGYGMADQGEAFDTACRVLDAFLERNP